MHRGLGTGDGPVVLLHGGGGSDHRRHGDGFAKIPLGLRSGHRLRLHVWPVEGRRGLGATEPHGHRWPFASWIITGALQETGFEVVDDGFGMGLRVEQFDYWRDRDGTAHDSRQGWARLRPTGSVVRDAGAVYSREPDELHSAEPLDGVVAASLVVQGVRRTSPTSVYRSPGWSESGGHPLTAAETRTFLVEIVDVLRRVRR